MITAFMRTLIIYIILIGTLRLMGKRQIGELRLSELVTTFLLSELAVIPIQDPDIPVSHAVVPILLLLSLEVIISFIITKSKKLKLIFVGKPSVIICHGKLNQHELQRLRMGTIEFLSELRLKNISDIADIEYAILEENGKLSVFPKADKLPVTMYDMNLSATETGIAHSVIIDGEISDANLKLAHKNEKWLLKILEEEKKNIADILLFTVDDSGKTNIIMKEKSK